MGVTAGQSTTVVFTAYLTAGGPYILSDALQTAISAILYNQDGATTYAAGAGLFTRVGAGVYSFTVAAAQMVGDWVSIVIATNTVGSGVDPIHWRLDNPYGVGAIPVTITVNDTEGNTVPDVLVWVTSDFAGSTLIAGPARTSAAGTILLYLTAGNYYIRAQATGWTFAGQPYYTTIAGSSDSYTISDAALYADSNYGTVSTASSYSFLTRMIDNIYSLTDEPQINKKYTTDDVIAKIQEEYVLILQRVNRHAKNKMVVTWSFTPSNSVSRYTLPPNVGAIKSVYTKNSAATTSPRYFFYDHMPEAAFPGQLSIEGQTLKFNLTDYPTMFQDATTVYVDYVPTGVGDLFEQVITTYTSTSATIPLASPIQGNIDRRHNAYLGAVLRVVQDNNNVQTQERIITSQTFSGTNLVITFEPALDPVPDSANLRVEIKPPMPLNMDMLIALGVAARIVDREGSAGRAQALWNDYNTKLGDLIQTVNQMNVMEGPNTSRRALNRTTFRRLR
jgi:hypothetical protein